MCNREPDDVLYCPECGAEYINTLSRGHSTCVQCDCPRLVDIIEYEEIQREKAAKIYEIAVSTITEKSR